MNWKVQAQRVQREAYVYYFAFKHPRVPWYAKLVAACSAAYLFSPIQLIPSYIPVIGFLDDFLVLFVAARLLQRIIPPEVLAECRALADAAEMRRKQEIRSTGAIIGFVAIAAVWLLVAAGVSILIARYIFSDTAMAK
ncbi:MAG: YkvA family protein [Candidatus Acidiferrales bacterium]